MAHPVTAPYGSWSSPITPEVLTQGMPVRDMPQLQGNLLYWQESRPDQNGRITIMACDLDRDGNPTHEREVLPYPLSARSKVNEYGGRAWVVDEHSLYFVLQDDQRVYQLSLTQPNATPAALTPDNPDFRHADLAVDPHPQQSRLVCIREDYSSDPHEPSCAIVAIATHQPGEPVVLVDGADFFAYPRFSPDGQNLCWISWNHPNMPWDGTTLYKARITDNGLLADTQQVTGGKEESIFQPSWSPDGELYFVSDRSGWWNLYCLRQGNIRHLVNLPAEFGLPLWSLGMSTYAFVDNNYLAALYTRDGFWHLGLVNTDTGEMETLSTHYKALSSIQSGAGTAVFIGASETTPGDVVMMNAKTKTLTLVKSTEPSGLQGYLSSPQPLSYPTTDGDIAHGFYYPPHNQRYKSDDREKPPLVVMCHGGPTGACSPALNLKIQYWTSRGFALLDVNYRGSTGYGREYREKLTNRWGITDVDDVAAGARHLARLGAIDPLRTLIRGSSAGGYTVLAALTFTDQFRAGASLYGIGNLESLAKDTHKFESRYLEKLVGPYPAEKQRYQDRSPASHAQQLNCPIIFLQGLEDRVVPPNQAEEMVKALEKKGLPVAYITFRDEGHGFRKAGNIKAAMEAELYFFRSILGIASLETLPRIAIKNRK